MQVEEFESLTAQDLRQRANELFARAAVSNEWVREGLLVEARFYLDEIEKRKNDRISQRDFRMELIVIGLILGEIIVAIGLAIWGGREQAREMNQQLAAFGEMEEVLSHLEDSSKATADTLTQLQAVNDLNAAGPRSSSKSFPVKIDISYSPTERHLVVTNLGKYAISILGYRFDGRRGPKFNPPNHLTPGGEFNNIPIDESMEHVPSDAEQPWFTPFHVSFKGADGTQYYSTTILAYAAIRGSYHVSCGPTSITEYSWTRPDPRKSHP